jgi:glycosyltransferase involved in cell wall biosynthesis
MKLGLVSGFGKQIPPRGSGAVEMTFWGIANRLSADIDVCVYSKSSSLIHGPANPRVRRVYLNRFLSMADTVLDHHVLYKKFILRKLKEDRRDIIQCNNPAFSELHGLCDKFVYSCHNSPGGGLDIDRFDAGTREKVLATFDSADRIHCISDYVKMSLAPYVADKGKFKVIYNAIDTRSFKPSHKEPIVLCVGGIMPTKGQLHLLDAFSRINTDWKLLIVGDYLRNADNIRYYNECAKYKSRNIQFLGPMVQDRVKELFGMASICVVPSTWQEAFGMVNIEAMASGCAVVATAVGGIPEIITDGRTGFLVPPNDPEAIKEKLSTLMGDGELLDSMAKRARDDVVRRFDWDGIARQYLDFYRSLA